MMRWMWAVLMMACGSAETVAPALAVQREGLEPGSVQARRYIVSLAAGARPGEIAHAHGLTPTRIYRLALNGFAAEIPDAALDGLRRNPNVRSIHPVQVVRASAVPSWGLDRVNQRDLPLDGLYAAPNDGAGVRVYVLDTGVLEHEELLNRAGSGYDAIDDDMDASDCHGHGTHVAGTVAGTNVGIARRATIIAVRMLNCDGSGTTDQVLAAIEWTIANHQKPAVVNASWGGGIDPPIDAAVQAAVAAGITWVSAAGNSDADACNYSPARAPASLTIGASDQMDNRAYFSNWGSCVDLFAPGNRITSLNFVGGYREASGTSMASPHVTGLAALYLAANPGASPAQVAAAILGGASADRLTDVQGSPNRLAYNGIAGAGVLNPLPRPDPSVRPIVSYVAPVHVADLDAAPVRIKGGWAAGVAVRVVDGNGNPVHRYSAEFRTDAGFTATCNLDFDGRCVAYHYAKNSVRAVTFTVIRVGPPSLYDGSANTDPDGDSNGNVIVVRKP